jgi:hypothetical protein
MCTRKTNSAGAEESAPTQWPDRDQRVHLRYGLNLGEHWKNLAFGPLREELITRIRDAGTALVRVFLDPGSEATTDCWPECAALLGAIQQTGATPMIAFSCPVPWNDPTAVQKFSRACGELAGRCTARWGSRAVTSWFWSFGDEPNSPWTNEGITFEAYRDIYERVADAIRQQLGSPEERPRIGGPCVDGFQPFWFDWIWRFVEEVDDSLVGFVAWNRYGEWREPGAWSAPADPDVFERLLLSRTSEYWSRAKAVASLLEGRGILNICSELNAHSHTDPTISSRFNQGLFGAVYYASSLIDLMRGSADGELLWAGACASGPYGALSARGEPTPTYLAKRLMAQSVRFGDHILFPLDRDPEGQLDAVLGSDDQGRRAAIVIHRSRDAAQVQLDRWPELANLPGASLLCESGVRQERLGDTLSFDGYGVALLHDGEKCMNGAW